MRSCRWWFSITAVVVLSLAVTGGSAHARVTTRARATATRPVTVFLDRDGRAVSDEVRIPRFGGGDRAWNRIVACVRDHYAPFQVDIVDRKPARGDFITAVIGGRASQLGLDDRWTNGVGPHSGGVIRNAVVFVFSKVGTGERDVGNLCAVAAHEVAHALGLDHSRKCGDIMSYWLDRCGPRRFLDADAPCGEDAARACAGGKRTQNSYRRLGALVGFRTTPPGDGDVDRVPGDGDRDRAPDPEVDPPAWDPWDDGADPRDDPDAREGWDDGDARDGWDDGDARDGWDDRRDDGRDDAREDAREDERDDDGWDERSAPVDPYADDPYAPYADDAQAPTSANRASRESTGRGERHRCGRQRGR